MKITSSKIENRLSYLTVEVEPLDLDEYLEKVYKILLKKIDVPGYTKGNVTRDVLENYVGRDKMFEGAIKEICSKIMQDNKLEAIMPPSVKTIQNNPLIFEMVVPLKPLVELGDYHRMKVEMAPLEVNKEEVDKVLEKLRLQFTKYNTVDRPAVEGDCIIVDIKGTSCKSLVMNKNRMRFKLTAKFFSSIPGLYEQMIGTKKGEEKEFKLKMPEDYFKKTIAGKEVTFQVKVHDIQEIVLPELNNEFAQKVAPDLKSLKLLVERIKNNMKIEKEQNAESKFEEKVVESLINISKFEYAPIMIDLDVEYLVNDYMQNLRETCEDDKEYEEKLEQVSENMLRTNAYPVSQKRVIWSIIVNEVAKAENIEIEETEIDGEIKHRTGDLEEQQQYIINKQNRENIKEFLKAKKAIKKLVEIVKVSNKLN